MFLSSAAVHAYSKLETFYEISQRIEFRAFSYLSRMTTLPRLLVLIFLAVIADLAPISLLLLIYLLVRRCPRRGLRAFCRAKRFSNGVTATSEPDTSPVLRSVVTPPCTRARGSVGPAGLGNRGSRGCRRTCGFGVPFLGLESVPCARERLRTAKSLAVASGARVSFSWTVARMLAEARLMITNVSSWNARHAEIQRTRDVSSSVVCTSFRLECAIACSSFSSR